MLYSMTGFGEAAVENEQIRVGFRIRTVNNRNLDINIKLPFDFMYLEGRLRDLLKTRLHRGRIDIYTEIDIRDPELKPPSPLNLPRIQQLSAIAETLKKDFQVTGELDVNQLVTLPDLTTTERVGFRLPDSVDQAILDTLDQAISRLNESRSLEGEQLADDLRKRFLALQDEVTNLRERVASRFDEMRETIRKRVETMMEDAEVDESRLAQEVLYHADRLDISEEITRLEAHQATSLELLDSDRRPLGKELDFMVQEQLREATTIGNKAKHKEIASVVVRLKTGYEKIREQVQNIE